MVKLASIELNADQDVAKGMKTSIIPLFSQTEGWKDFELLEDVKTDKTRTKVTIAKVGSFQTRANTTKKKGEKTNCWLLLNRWDFTKKIAATDDIKKGDKLTVTLEKL
jgi:hypothetical protein